MGSTQGILTEVLAAQPRIHPGLSCVVSSRPVTGTASPPPACRSLGRSGRFSHPDAPWPTPPSPTSPPPFLPFPLRSSRPGCLIAPGVHRIRLPQPFLLPGMRPQTSAGTRPPLTPGSDLALLSRRSPRGSLHLPSRLPISVPSCSTLFPSYCLYYPT